jgi:hypothetical protein
MRLEPCWGRGIVVAGDSAPQSSRKRSEWWGGVGGRLNKLAATVERGETPHPGPPPQATERGEGRSWNSCRSEAHMVPIPAADETVGKGRRNLDRCRAQRRS